MGLKVLSVVIASTFLLVGCSVAATAAAAAPVRRDFERTVPAAGLEQMDVVTNTGRVEISAGGDTFVIRGTVKRNVSWRGVQVTDAQIAKLVANPPIVVTSNSVRIERLTDEALWRGVAIDFVIRIPATVRLGIDTSSGSVAIDGMRADIRVATQSAAIRVDADDGNVDIRSASGAVRVSGTMASLAMRTQSGSIEAMTESVGDVEVASGSGSVTVSGIRGSLRAETSSSRIALAGVPGGAWSMRSGSGSIEVRIPSDSRFNLDASSRSGQIKTEFDVQGAIAATKTRLEGVVNGGGPKVVVETRSSSITIAR